MLKVATTTRELAESYAVISDSLKKACPALFGSEGAFLRTRVKQCDEAIAHHLSEAKGLEAFKALCQSRLNELSERAGEGEECR